MAADVKFSVKDATLKQQLLPVTVSEELENKFLKKSRSSSWKLIPATIVLSIIVCVILFLLIYFLRFFVISALGIFAIFAPIYAVYNVFATANAIKKHDYEFLEGSVVGKTDNGYKVLGLEDHNIAVLFGKKEYGPGDKVIVARLNDDLSIISEE